MFKQLKVGFKIFKKYIYIMVAYVTFVTIWAYWLIYTTLFHVVKVVVVVVIVVVIIIFKFLTSQLWLANIHLSWNVVINRIRPSGLICSLKSFLQLNMCQELQIFAGVYMYSSAS